MHPQSPPPARHSSRCASSTREGAQTSGRLPRNTLRLPWGHQAAYLRGASYRLGPGCFLLAGDPGNTLTPGREEHCGDEVLQKCDVLVYPLHHGRDCCPRHALEDAERGTPDRINPGTTMSGSLSPITPTCIEKNSAVFYLSSHITMPPSLVVSAFPLHIRLYWGPRLDASVECRAN